jgi:hypothetical protein
VLLENKKLEKLRTIINENLRTQVGGDGVDYISSGSVLADVSAKQSHCIFARRGCGKTLLLHHSRLSLASDTKGVYLNCEDYKNHSFPNVLIEILDSIFRELQSNLTGWFGKKKRLKEIVLSLRANLASLRSAPDTQTFDIKHAHLSEHENKQGSGAKLGVKIGQVEASFDSNLTSMFHGRVDVERKYTHNENKLQELNQNLPEYKEKIREFFRVAGSVKSVFVQVDDFYHLSRTDQPFVADYIHRLCKDTPLKFKIATLKHNSVLYIERNRQPIGIQERHDYQPINIDFTFEHFERTCLQNKEIFHEYASMSGMSAVEFDFLFKGKGFERLILAGGGVPRDCLSFFLEVLQRVRTSDSQGRIGKDDVRFLSKETFERRIEELKQDSEGQDQEALLRGIYVIRNFCLEKKGNIFLIAENEIQKDDDLKTLIYRLLDYRIIHKVANSLTHKSKAGVNYQAFAIDIGCYAFMRNLDGKMLEIDLSEATAKEKMRSSPILERKELHKMWRTAPIEGIEKALVSEEVEA